MKTEVKKIDEHKRELTIQVEGDVVKQKFNQVYERINKEAKTPGFRPGKVPRDILEKNYAGLAKQEILKELLPQVYKQALTETNLEPICEPQISEVILEKESLSFQANLEIKPKIELKNYKGLRVEYNSTEPTQQEIDHAFDKLKVAYTQMSNEEIVHSLGYPSLEILKGVLAKQICLEKTRYQQMELENGVIEQLLKQVNFKVPSVMTQQHLQRLVQQAEIDLAMRGINKEDIQKQRPTLEKNLEVQAEKQVRAFLVLEEVARRENIAQDDKMSQKALELLLRKADWKISK